MFQTIIIKIKLSKKISINNNQMFFFSGEMICANSLSTTVQMNVKQLDYIALNKIKQ